MTDSGLSKYEQNISNFDRINTEKTFYPTPTQPYGGKKCNIYKNVGANMGLTMGSKKIRRAPNYESQRNKTEAISHIYHMSEDKKGTPKKIGLKVKGEIVPPNKKSINYVTLKSGKKNKSKIVKKSVKKRK